MRGLDKMLLLALRFKRKSGFSARNACAVERFPSGKLKVQEKVIQSMSVGISMHWVGIDLSETLSFLRDLVRKGNRF